MKEYIVYTKEKGEIETDNYNDFEGLTRHREDGPAYQRFYNNGQLEYEEYYLNGIAHRLDGPAFQTFYDNGQLSYEEYWINGKRCRLDGPAVLKFLQNTEVQYIQYWINGIYYSKSTYTAKIFKMKLSIL